jgi:hypothetical protein
MDAKSSVAVPAEVLTTLADRYVAQNKLMSRRVTTLSWIIGGLLFGGGLWYVGILERWFPSQPQVGISAITDLVRRLGAVVVVIFLVRIFVPLLRYAAELEIFYQSRAGVLRILAGAADSEGRVSLPLRSIVEVLSSDKIQLGAAPESPVAELVATAQVGEKGLGGARAKTA